MAKTDEEYTAILNRRDSDVEFQWRNFHLRFFSMDTKTILLGLLIVACTVYVGMQWFEDRQTDKESRKVYLEQHRITQALLATVIDNQTSTLALIKASLTQSEHVINATEESAYILTLTQQKREALHLEMPQSLRRKLNER